RPLSSEARRESLCSGVPGDNDDATYFFPDASGRRAAFPELCSDGRLPGAYTDKPKDVFGQLKFRNLGPAIAGGRVAAVAGVPGDPLIYYVGAGGGGVFKTADGGLNWKPIFEHEETSSIGAIAVAASNPNIVWVGTGEANIRNDVLPGAGAYLSTDAGKTWR